MGCFRSYARVLSAVLLALLFCGCMEGDRRRITETIQTIRGKQEITVLVVGDGISAAAPYEGSTYAEILRSELSPCVGPKISMINSSRDGMTFRQAKRIYQEDVFAFRPDVIFVMLGMSDLQDFSGYIDPFERAVGEYFDILAREGTLVVVLTITGYQSRGPNDGTSNLVASYNDELFRQAILHHFPVIDVAERMTRVWMRSPEEYRRFFDDDIHLSVGGHAFVAGCVMDVFRRATEASRDY